MPTLTIRNLPKEVYDELRREAAVHRRSMEEEACHTLSERYRKKMSPEEIMGVIAALNAKARPLPPDAKMDFTDSFNASKRIDMLYEEGLIPLAEKKAWDEKIDHFEVSLPEVELFFRKLWPWTPKSGLE